MAHIWGFIHDPCAIESFALCNKGVYDLSDPYLEEYHGLRRRFQALGGSDNQLFAGHNFPLAAHLKHFILNPTHALYVTSARLYGQSYGSPFSREQRQELLDIQNPVPETPFRRCGLYHKADMELFTQAVRNCSWIKESEAEEWVEAIESGASGPIVALLITKVQNIQKLLLSIHQDSKWFSNVIKRSSSATSTSLLRSLAEVTIMATQEKSDHCMPLIDSLGALPSVTSVSYYMSQGSAEGATQQCHNSNLLPWNSKLKHLDLNGCTISASTLSRSLRRPESLQSLRYLPNLESLTTKGLSLIRATLLAYASHSLEKLKLPLELKDTVYICSLQNFKALERLECNISTLLYRPLHGKGYTFPIKDSLPESIECLTLKESNSIFDLLPPIEELSWCKEAKLFAKLNIVTVHLSQKAYEEAQSIEQQSVDYLVERMEKFSVVPDCSPPPNEPGRFNILSWRPTLLPYQPVEIDCRSRLLKYLEQLNNGAWGNSTRFAIMLYKDDGDRSGLLSTSRVRI